LDENVPPFIIQEPGNGDARFAVSAVQDGNQVSRECEVAFSDSMNAQELAKYLDKLNKENWSLCQDGDEDCKKVDTPSSDNLAPGQSGSESICTNVAVADLLAGQGIDL